MRSSIPVIYAMAAFLCLDCSSFIDGRHSQLIRVEDSEVNSQTQIIEARKYHSLDSSFCLTILSVGDTLLARQCLVAYYGERIDCCLDEPSIVLTRFSNGSYVGWMRSCYDDSSRHVTLIPPGVDSRMMLLVQSNGHEFIPDSVELR